MAYIISGFRNIFNFKGRCTRPEFWWFALAAGIIFFFLNVGVSIYVFIKAVLIDTEARGGLTAGSITSEQEAHVIKQIVELIFKASVISFATIFLMLSSAVVRRLHDVGNSGILLFSFCIILFLNVWLFAYFGPNIVLRPDLKFWAQLVLWITGGYEVFVIIVILIALCRESEPFDNKFGPNPYPLDFEQLKQSIISIAAPSRHY